MVVPSLNGERKQEVDVLHSGNARKDYHWNRALSEDKSRTNRAVDQTKRIEVLKDVFLEIAQSFETEKFYVGL